ncbi:small integral membrane protein 13 [Acomys russatus]|uniref:small integral membrane protein 13 n=1 Tax=Acomys russatus TaxID=60746 RepID=UPI0021E31E0D|nr:small integral membrane protein 13 [Acomys russatus]
MWHNVGLTLLVFVATLLIVLLLMVCGWYFVWHLFLSKFKFLRELVGDTGSQEGDHEQPSGSETEEDPSASPHRIRSARQRRAPADEGH